MPDAQTPVLIGAERLESFVADIFRANGCDEAEAGRISHHLLGANLAGHDSHGVIQIPGYIDRVKAGHIVPGAPFTIVQESRTTTVVDGNWGFGYVINEKAMALTIEKANSENIAATTVFRPVVGLATRFSKPRLPSRGSS